VLSASFTSSWARPTDTGKPNSLSDEEIQEYDRIIQEIKDGEEVFGSMGIRQKVMMRLEKRQDNISTRDVSRRNGFSKRLGGALSRSFQSAYSGREREETSETTMMVMPGRRQSVQPGLSNILHQSQDIKMMLQDIELSDSEDEDEGDCVKNESGSGSQHSSRLRRKSLLLVTERSPSTERAKGNKRRLTRESLGFDSFASHRVGSLICGFCKPGSRAGSLICGFRRLRTCSTKSSIVDGKKDGLICDWSSRRSSSSSSLASGVWGRDQTIARRHSISSLTCDWDGLDLTVARAA